MADFGDPFLRKPDAAVLARNKVPNRAAVLQAKMIGQSHPTGLTSNLLRLFEPRPPIEYKAPIEKKQPPPYTGMAQFVHQFAEKGDPEYQPPKIPVETRAQKRARIQKLKLEKGVEKAAADLEQYDPHKDPNIVGDPYKTLFVAGLSYESTEETVRREFQIFGPIKRVTLVHDKNTNMPRGYAFVEYMHTRDMKTAYKQADGQKIDNRRVLVDVERGRTVPNWRPRRLGGGLGSTRVGGDSVNQRRLGREPQSAGRPRLEELTSRDDMRRRDRNREHSIERPRGGERSQDREQSRDRVRSRDRDRKHNSERDIDARSHDRHHRSRQRDREPDLDRDADARGHDRHHRNRDSDHGTDKDLDVRAHDHRHHRNRERTREYDLDGDRDHERKRKREQE